MKYLEHINFVLRNEVGRHEEIIVYGQNVSAGSRISGFTRGFQVKGSGKIINTTNTENSLVGFGFGIMLGGGVAAFFMKQLDFLFLGIDQIVNTYNILRNGGHAKGSFTILPVTVDMGYEGPQSSSNNFGDFCSMARVPGFVITNKNDAEKIIPAHLGSPGFRIISVSQRLYKEEIIDPGEPILTDQEYRFAQYREGKDVTIVSFNFSFPYAWKIHEEAEKKGLKTSLFNVNYMTPIDWTPIVENAKKTKKLIVIDDSKSENLSCYSLLAEIRKNTLLDKDIFISRKLESNWLNPVSDAMEIDFDSIIRKLK